MRFNNRCLLRSSCIGIFYGSFRIWDFSKSEIEIKKWNHFSEMMNLSFGRIIWSSGKLSGQKTQKIETKVILRKSFGHFCGYLYRVNFFSNPSGFCQKFKLCIIVNQVQNSTFVAKIWIKSVKSLNFSFKICQTRSLCGY